MGVDAQEPVHRVQQQTFRHDSQLETSVHAGRKNQCHVVSLHALPSSGRATRSHRLTAHDLDENWQSSGKLALAI